ncbi:MAG: ribosome assembly cofactor RimP [Bacteroidales bacterium]|nr:ribosome assembly cofactor RimP [Bacteroidales bacterium]
MIEALLTEKEVFIVSLEISTANKIRLIIDSFRGVTIDDCVAFSRAIEHNLDREEEDFELEVSSAGISEPFQIREQYLKNLGKDVEIQLTTGAKVSGKLVEVKEDGYIVEQIKKVTVEGKKKKQSISESLNFVFSEGHKVRLQLKFK